MSSPRIPQVALSTPFDTDETDFDTDNTQEAVEIARFVPRRIQKKMRVPAYFTAFSRMTDIEAGAEVTLEANAEWYIL